MDYLIFNNITISVVQLLNLTVPLFFLGVYGIINNRESLITILISIELMLLAVNLNFIIFSVYLDDIMGQIFSLFILTVAASESAIGLAILVVYYRLRGSINIDVVNSLKG